MLLFSFEIPSRGFCFDMTIAIVVWNFPFSSIKTSWGLYRSCSAQDIIMSVPEAWNRSPTEASSWSSFLNSSEKYTEIRFYILKIPTYGREAFSNTAKDILAIKISGLNAIRHRWKHLETSRKKWFGRVWNKSLSQLNM